MNVEWKENIEYVCTADVPVGVCFVPICDSRCLKLRVSEKYYFCFASKRLYTVDGNYMKVILQPDATIIGVSCGPN